MSEKDIKIKEIDCLSKDYTKCPLCGSSNTEITDNSAVIICNGVLEVYYHLYCHDCNPPKSIPFVLCVREHEKHCRCNVCEKLWDGKDRNPE